LEWTIELLNKAFIYVLLLRLSSDLSLVSYAIFAICDVLFICGWKMTFACLSQSLPTIPEPTASINIGLHLSVTFHFSRFRLGYSLHRGGFFFFFFFCPKLLF
jgi:hypothetical protein